MFIFEKLFAQDVLLYDMNNLPKKFGLSKLGSTFLMVMYIS